MGSTRVALWTRVRCATVAVLATGGIPGIIGAQATSRASAPVAQETGQFSSSGTIVWLRVDDGGSVLVFAARGFRSAFAHPSVLTADETERWSALFAAFQAADSAAQADREGGSGGPHSEDTASIHGEFADGDVTLQQQMVGQATALVMRYGARGPAPVTATYPALALRNIIPTLDRTAKLARAIAAANKAAAAAAAVASATAPATPTAPGSSEPENGHPGVAPTTPTPAASSAPTTLPASAPPVVAAPKVAPGHPASSVAASSPPASSSGASQAAIAPTPPASVVVPVALPTSPSPATQKPGKPHEATTQAPSRAPSALGGSTSPQIGYVVDPPDSRIEYTAAPVAPTAGTTEPGTTRPSVAVDGLPPSPAGAGGAPTPVSAPAATKAAGGASNAADSAAGDSVAEKALSSEGRLSPAVLGDVIRQRQQLLQYCYTEFGLRADAALAGEIVVRLVIQQDGTVSEVTVPQHHWSGHGADKVEACIRDRILLWVFPAAQRASTHEIQLIFGR